MILKNKNPLIEDYSFKIGDTMKNFLKKGHS